MDQATHLISGIIQGRYFQERLNIKILFSLCVVGALIPDIDIIAYIFDKREYIIHHRSLSHGVLTSIFWSFLILLFYHKKISFKVQELKKLTMGVLFSILGHLYLDLMTSYGTSLLSPLSHKRFALDALFIIDPIYWAILFVSFLLMKSFKVKTKRIYSILLIIWLLYPLSCLTVKSYLQNRLKAQNGTSLVEVLPDFLAPINWKLIEASEDSLSLKTHNIITGKTRYIRSFRPVREELLAEDIQGDRFLNFYFNRFLRFGAMLRDGDKIRVLDLRFYPTANFQGLLTQKDLPFQLSLYTNQGKLSYYEIGQKRYYTKRPYPY
ncbi:MAG: metal-dependent hydrolase [Desulfatiglandales bacterium]